MSVAVETSEPFSEIEREVRKLERLLHCKTDDDELMDAVLLELQVQVGVGEAAGTPVFLCDNLTWRGHEFGTELATPCAVFEALVLPRGSLNRRNVGPRFVVACTISMMHGIED